MSSREIAVTVNSTHDNVLKTIRRLISEGVVFGNETPYTNAQNGQTYSEFMLSFRDTMVVASGYSAEMRAKIIDRWQELENAQPKFDPSNLSRLDILKLAMDSEERAIQAISERDQAIATKAQIGSRREASAMATASAAKREVVKLKDLIGEAAHRASVLAVEGATKVRSGIYDWRVLKNYCMVNELEIGKAWNPGMQKDVNTYPAEAWFHCHGIDLGELFAGQRELT
jgi:phage regulator Rha-like protein